jgi:hypothetical protein
MQGLIAGTSGMATQPAIATRKLIGKAAFSVRRQAAKTDREMRMPGVYNPGIW